MYISDRDALRYISRAVLLILPFLASMFLSWSWIIEIILIFALFIHGRHFGLRLTAIFLAMGYLAAFIPLGPEGFIQIGFTPWAGVFFLLLKEKGLPINQTMFWSIMLAAVFSALPTIQAVNHILKPEILNQHIEANVELYEQQGLFESLEKQGMPREELEKSVRLAVAVFYKLIPAFAGIMGMLEIGLVYFIIRLSEKKERKITPFTLWRFPWYAVWVAILGLSLYLGGDYFNADLLKIAGMNIMFIIAVPCIILGLSCAVYYSLKPNVPRFLFWFIIIAAVIFPHYILIALLFTGLFDLVFNFRRISERNEGAKQ